MDRPIVSGSVLLNGLDALAYTALIVTGVAMIALRRGSVRAW